MDNFIRDCVFKYIDSYKTRDPFELADLLKIQIQKGNLGDLCGCYMYLKKNRCIFLNNNLSYEESKTVMAHELGHAILHKKTNCCFLKNKTLFITSKIERQANIFAAELLIDNTILKEFSNYNLNMEQISLITGINLELIKIKLGVEE